MNVVVDRILSDQGSVVIFSGLNDEGTARIHFAADHRPAQDILNALEEGYDPICFVEDWQIIGGDEA